MNYIRRLILIHREYPIVWFRTIENRMDQNDVLRNLWVKKKPNPKGIIIDNIHFRRGITLTSGTCTLEKTEDSRLIGISIGGGAPRCPCVYIVQVFDGTLAFRDGSLSAGMKLSFHVCYWIVNDLIRWWNSIC